jgi:type I restriction enzyme R subunit
VSSTHGPHQRRPHAEAAFETVIEAHLLENGYISVHREGFDRERALFPEAVLALIRETQPAEWAKLEALHGAKTGEQVLADLCKWGGRRARQHAADGAGRRR